MSDNIVDLGAERNKREQPDPEHVRHDEYGRPLYRFLTEYTLDGKDGWGGVDVWAYSWDDAEKRIAAICESLTLLGPCYSTVPA